MNNHQVMVPSQFALEAESIACSVSGGCTAIPGARGVWVDGENTVHYDDITVVLVFEAQELARDAIVAMLFERGEQCVCYTTNGTPALVYSPVQSGIDSLRELEALRQARAA